MIPFNKPPVIGREIEYIQDAIENGHLCGDGKYTRLCHEWLEKNTGAKKALLTTSCTHALEMTALLLNIQPGDEVIMPSYTFVSTANAFVLRGAKIIFVDIRPDTMNIDETKIEAAITSKTKVIVPVHYAGVACEMDTIMEIADRYNLFVVEDAAQGLMAKYKGKMLGTIGHLGTYSFHETKNFVSGEGGALLINDKRFIERAEIIREKGTNRSQFFRGQVDKYSWQDVGSSYLPNELTAAYLFAQFENIQMLHKERLEIWTSYYEELKNIKQFELPFIPNECEHNGHIFYLKVRDLEERTKLMNYLKQNEIQSTFHYVPLHSANAGLKYGIFRGEDNFTSSESERLVRLPLYFGLSEFKNIIKVLEKYSNENQ
ncbi:dTDP-4-amino-4,6-dideoxygalactose transaminase [Bacillus ndiopicus]|uniref:dTDP-4-amino-4,6-dideoxygalactose transaminase n=1 Tax=Bacillus ndiopicus TaxID=1347368 RepID=UPI0005A958F6|nr:dTDP-4-amino-4,6-dideoxygalactose transaminase [Bacillus ndiopicus]